MQQGKTVKNLQALIRILTKAEKQQLIAYLKDNSQFTKRANLFKLANSRRVISDLVATQYLYGTLPHSAFSHLKARLEKQIHHHLLSLPSTTVQEEIYHKRGLAYIFMQRSAWQLAQQQLEAAFFLARKYQLSLPLLQLEGLFHQLKSHVPAIPYPGKEPDVKQTTKQLQQMLEARRAEAHLSNWLQLHNPNPNTLPTSIDSSEGSLIKRDVKAFPPENRFWILRTRAWIYHANRNWMGASSALDKVEELMLANRRIFSKTVRQKAQLQKAYALVHIGRKKEAAGLVEKVHSQSASKGIAMEASALAFRIALLKKKMNFARDELARGLTASDPQNYPFQTAILNYYQACMAFWDENPSLSNKLLQQCAPLLQSKSKWLIGLKTLEIYNLSMQGQLDLAEFRFEALHQLLKRQKAYDVSRGKIIVQLLRRFFKYGGNPSETLTKHPDLLWRNFRPWDYEVIPPRKWLEMLSG